MKAEETRLLELAGSGDLVHDVMETHEPRIRTCVFVRRDGSWSCVLTHLSQLTED